MKKNVESGGPEPYPHKFHVSISLAAYRGKYDGLVAGATDCTDKVSVAGRVYSKYGALGVAHGQFGAFVPRHHATHPVSDTSIRILLF